MPGYASKLYAFPRACVALGQRVGMKCEELGISIGRADHLYLCFTPSLPEGAVRTTDYAVEPWHRFALYGIGCRIQLPVGRAKAGCGRHD